MQLIFFTSDLHFNHKNILKFQPEQRQVSDIADMNETIVRNWNKQVANTDTVYILGDIALGSKTKTKALLARLNGIKHLVLGNHDQNVPMDAFASVSTYLEVTINGTFVVMFHYPIARWNKQQYGALHLFGHCHGSYTPEGRSMDVGIDSRTDMCLWSWQEVKELLENKEILSNH